MSGLPQGSVGMDGLTTTSGRIPTALRDRELESFGTPDPRILVCGCGGSGNGELIGSQNRQIWNLTVANPCKTYRRTCRDQ